MADEEQDGIWADCPHCGARAIARKSASPMTGCSRGWMLRISNGVMTMTSEERREVAKRLRKLPSDTYAAIKEWEECGLSIYADISDEADYSQIYDAVFGVFPAEYMCPGDYEELHERLADLIEPTPVCHAEQDYDRDEPIQGRWWKCDGCGERFIYERGFAPRFCPECGARVVDEDD